MESNVMKIGNTEFVVEFNRSASVAQGKIIVELTAMDMESDSEASASLTLTFDGKFKFKSFDTF